MLKISPDAEKSVDKLDTVFTVIYFLLLDAYLIVNTIVIFFIFYANSHFYNCNFWTLLETFHISTPNYALSTVLTVIVCIQNLYKMSEMFTGHIWTDF